MRKRTKMKLQQILAFAIKLLMRPHIYVMLSVLCELNEINILNGN